MFKVNEAEKILGIKCDKNGSTMIGLKFSAAQLRRLEMIDAFDPHQYVNARPCYRDLESVLSRLLPEGSVEYLGYFSQSDGAEVDGFEATGLTQNQVNVLGKKFGKQYAEGWCVDEENDVMFDSADEIDVTGIEFFRVRYWWD